MDVLGKDAALPKDKVDYDKIDKGKSAAEGAFHKSRDELEANILALLNFISDYKNGLKQTAAAYAKNDFGLNPKKPDDAKKLKAAEKVIAKFLSDFNAMWDQESKALTELQNHAIQMAKYKSSQR
ncbi:MAG TPA: hypothetical protein VKS60_11055 [Stellaceae bacterium]|nr:hypothetical protein [Stellaceae bacterium]